MAVIAENVIVAVTGGVYNAPAGTPLPTSAAAPRTGFIEQGYIGEDGITQSMSSSNTQIRAWQNGDVVRTIQTEHDLTYQFMMIETSPAVLETYYGNYNAGTVEINAGQLGRKPWMFDIKDGENEMRIVVPDGQITERGDVTYATAEAIGYMVTVSCYADPAYAGTESAPAKAYLYLDV